MGPCTHRDRPSTTGRAFTLLEVVVVFVMLGIVAAFVVPTLRAVVDRGDRQYAAASVEQVRVAELGWAATDGRYTTVASNLPPLRGLQVVTSSSAGPDQVSVAVGDDQSVGIAALAEDGTCLAAWMTAPDPAATLTVASSAAGDFDEPAVCTGAEAIAEATGGTAAALPAGSQ